MFFFQAPRLKQGVDGRVKPGHDSYLHNIFKALSFFVFILCSCALAQAQTILQGNPEQGGLVEGKTQPGAMIKLDGHPVPLDPEGRFLLGFSREAKESAELTIRLPDGKMETKQLKITPRDWQIQRIDGLPEKQVTPDPKTLERIKRENQLIVAARGKSVAQSLYLSGFIKPVEGVVSGVFGSQRILNGQPRAAHSGVDIAAVTGTPVLAAADGVVILAQPDLFYTGQTIMLDHGLGLNSVYAHLSAITVKLGQKIKRGEVIGKVGASGRATGPHLHWGLAWGEVRLDPERALAVFSKR
jgi:murein DD-endopeptidase MepM/ murein hydrolase activator NlpD